jgi:hypothetical protein
MERQIAIGGEPGLFSIADAAATTADRDERRHVPQARQRGLAQLQAKPAMIRACSWPAWTGLVM